MKKNNITEFDEYKSNNFNMPDNPEIEELSDEMIDAYLNAIDLETPDLWNRIEVGFEKEYSQMLSETNTNVIEFSNNTAVKKRKASRRYMGLVAAVILITIIAIPIMNLGGRTKSDTKSDNKTSDSVMDNATAKESMDEAPSFDNAYSESASDEAVSSGENYNVAEDDGAEKAPDDKILCANGNIIITEDEQYVLKIKDVISNDYEEYSFVSGDMIIIINPEIILKNDGFQDKLTLVEITINEDGHYEAKIK